jgi:HPr kinase/phosphorylase
VRASAPETLRGMIEARGIGILRAEPLRDVPLALVVDLDRESGLRMPEPQVRSFGPVDVDAIPGQYIPNLAAAVMVRLRGVHGG